MFDYKYRHHGLTLPQLRRVMYTPPCANVSSQRQSILARSSVLRCLGGRMSMVLLYCPLPSSKLQFDESKTWTGTLRCDYGINRERKSCCITSKEHDVRMRREFRKLHVPFKNIVFVTKDNAMCLWRQPAKRRTQAGSCPCLLFLYSCDMFPQGHSYRHSYTMQTQTSNRSIPLNHSV